MWCEWAGGSWHGVLKAYREDGIDSTMELIAHGLQTSSKIVMRFITLTIHSCMGI